MNCTSFTRQVSRRPVHYDYWTRITASVWHYWKLYLSARCLSGMSLVTNDDDDGDDDDDDDDNNNNNNNVSVALCH